MDSITEYSRGNQKKKKFDFKKHKDNTLRSLNEVEKFLNCATKAKNYASLLRFFK